MSLAKPFTITSFVWRKEVEERFAAAAMPHDSDETILENLSALARFLDLNSLSTRKLVNTEHGVDRSFVLRSDDLTEMGLALIRKGYEKWRKNLKNPSDVRALENALSKLQRQNG